MKGLRIVLWLMVGLGYLAFSIFNSELQWIGELGAAGAIVMIEIIIRLIAGKDLPANPLEADEMPSLNLTQRKMDGDQNVPR